MRSRRDFKRMASHCLRHQGKLLFIDEKKNHRPETRLGITVTRRFGDAHLRNRFKRVVREAFRLCYADLRKGIDLNVKPRPQALSLTVEEAQHELRRFFGYNSNG